MIQLHKIWIFPFENVLKNACCCNEGEETRSSKITGLSRTSHGFRYTDDDIYKSWIVLWAYHVVIALPCEPIMLTAFVRCHVFMAVPMCVTMLSLCCPMCAIMLSLSCPNWETLLSRVWPNSDNDEVRHRKLHESCPGKMWRNYFFKSSPKYLNLMIL